MDKKKALGRGMASLIPDPSVLSDEAPPPKTYFYCGIENVLPNKEQPRKAFNDEKLLGLAASIKEKGILQPIIVRRLSDFQYEIIAGERRWRAAQKAGLSQVPVIIRESSVSGKLEEALIENLQREDLNAMEEADAYHKLIEEHEYTQEELAKKIGKDRSTIANSLRLLVLSPAVRELVSQGKITSGHARALLSIEDVKRQEEIAKDIVKKELSVRQVEALVKTGTKRGHPKQSEGSQDIFITTLEQELSQHFKAKVRIDNRWKKGKIEIEYFGDDELNRIISLLKA
ncbi:MAG: hypothetical protein A2Z91_04360 [Deltaproteobacteria bacterium GWA2_38_16]|nr:MAG: hypothetical protein A2Z91_04360 [Deltaproteobacteria bacterium GWA2_38_16]OGQ01764.1 MAG: hypothetical protein A3D19_07820 [Deltaproteobacteria bacterium RIFCSPHIGHO2_02_FULL_38_15]OGQ33446.1 MAG: hypothetical protein A3A72_00690 [Deltaproteobacteria bacterium RIFCSPLOWO2_01_FULL_38_9]OGQ59443.1 MAG: hypothetical protein A3G92_01845 [Deltaproteobacteria bacterium RIFCSPLOWO2_12_FULL_38_8]HBQ21433.1 chromosome partitioning protein ParB [Deltaproteobacteria bacterium]